MTGTSVLGIKFDGGVMVAADTLGTSPDREEGGGDVEPRECECVCLYVCL